MPIPNGQISTSAIWTTPTEEIIEKLPPEEVTEVVVEVESDDE